MSTYSKEDILNALDAQEPYNFFLDLEHGYCYTAGSRINLYADEERWAIVFEKSGFGNRSGRAELELNYFGNCLSNLDKAGYNDVFTCNSKYLPLISGDDFDKIESDFELVAKDARVVKIRDTELPIEQDIEKYKNQGIEIQDFDNPDNLIDYKSLVLYLNELHPEHFRATEEELRMCIPGDLRFLMNIDQWHHKSHNEYDGVDASSYETFQLIADVLVNRDTTRWKPTLEANNDWRNWPKAGSL